MSETERARILLVDDEVRVLEAMRRNLRTHFDITTATSGSEALDILEHQGPFAVLVSDLRMPGMGGLELLAQARKSAPDTTRVLLTGKTDLASALTDAARHPGVVSEGTVFRFLTKPLLPDLFLKALQAAVEHHRSTTAERALLEPTVQGSIKALTDSSIPHLEPVREILPNQQKNQDGSGLPRDEVRGEAVPEASRALRVGLDRNVPEAQSTKPGVGFDTLKGRLGNCVPVASLAGVHGEAHEASPSPVGELQLGELKLGMIFAADVKTVEGVLLFARGQEVDSVVIRRLQKLDSEVGVKQPLRVARR